MQRNTSAGCKEILINSKSLFFSATSSPTGSWPALRFNIQFDESNVHNHNNPDRCDKLNIPPVELTICFSFKIAYNLFRIFHTYQRQHSSIGQK